MPSKGIDVFTWIGLRGWHVEYTVPKDGVTHDGFRAWKRHHLEVDTKNIDGFLGTKGPFAFIVKDDRDNVVLQKKNTISALDFDVDEGDMTTIPDMQSLVKENYVVTFGFYDSGPGIAQLPKSHMCWVTVTPNWSNWMGEVAPPGSPQSAKPFVSFVLPSPHDSGMNSMKSTMALLDNVSDISPVTEAIGGVFGLDKLLGKTTVPKIITALAITQKDTITAMLQTGARYFEFRPAHMSTIFKGIGKLGEKLFFQHAMIPGIPFDDFLKDLVSFLNQHPQEIIVVQIRFDGVHQTCARATDDEINRYVADALAPTNGSIDRGGYPIMQKTTDDIRAAKKRLIILTNAGQISTYTDEANATLSGDKIVATFPTFSTDFAKQSAGKQLAVWQCQATATNIRDVVIYSVLSANDATSPLLCTKPLCDQATLPWLQQNAMKVPSNVLQAIMNDFFDGATADVAIGLSKQYLDHQ